MSTSSSDHIYDPTGKTIISVCRAVNTWCQYCCCNLVMCHLDVSVFLFTFPVLSSSSSASYSLLAAVLLLPPGFYTCLHGYRAYIPCARYSQYNIRIPGIKFDSYIIGVILHFWDFCWSTSYSSSLRCCAVVVFTLLRLHVLSSFGPSTFYFPPLELELPFGSEWPYKSLLSV